MKNTKQPSSTVGARSRYPILVPTFFTFVNNVNKEESAVHVSGSMFDFEMGFPKDEP